MTHGEKVALVAATCPLAALKSRQISGVAREQRPVQLQVFGPQQQQRHHRDLTPPARPSRHPPPAMSQFRAARLDLGSFVNVRNLRDHTKRKVFAEFEPERYA